MSKASLAEAREAGEGGPHASIAPTRAMKPSPPPDRRAIGILGAYIEGWRRVLRAPAVWAAILVVALPAIVAVWRPGDLVPGGTALRALEHDAADIARSQAFALLGPGPMLVVTQAYRLDEIGGANPLVVGPPLVIYLFLWGGILDRLARARVVGSGPFFAACGVYFWRLIRLSVPVALAYWVIWRGYPDWPGAVSLAGLLLVGIILSYAAVRMVVEDRRSALGSIVASLRFIRRRPIAVLTLYGLSVATVFAISTGWMVLMGWAPIAPSTLWSSVVMEVGLLVAFLSRLALVASAVALFQSSLAHADYTAAPLPMWPDSPAAEAIENLTRVGQKSESRGQNIP